MRERAATAPRIEREAPRGQDVAPVAAGGPGGPSARRGFHTPLKELKDELEDLVGHPGPVWRELRVLFRMQW